MCTYKIPWLAHDNGYAAIGSRIGTNQFGLLFWTTRMEILFLVCVLLFWQFNIFGLI